MKRIILIILLPVFSFSQDVSIGFWKDYMSYSKATKVEVGDNKTYCVTDGALYYLNQEDQSINRMSKVSGLSDIGINDVKFNNYTKQLIIVYSNCNIDIIENETVINISDIKRKEISGLKQINDIYFDENKAYFSCSFGLVVLDLVKKEIKDTYKIGLDANYVAINQIAINSDTIYCATSRGVYFAYKENLFLSDYNQWTKEMNFEKTNNIDNEYKDIIIFQDKLIIAKKSNYDSLFIKLSSWEKYINNGFKNMTLSANSKFLAITDSSKIYTIKENESPIATDLFFSVNDCAYSENNDLWIADESMGLIYMAENSLTEIFSTISVNSPASNKTFNLYFDENLYVNHGGHVNFSSNQLNNEGSSVMDQYNSWDNYDFNELNKARDIVGIVRSGNLEYYASWYNGISVMENGIHKIKYGYDNTGGVLDTTYYSNNRIQISDLKIDNNNNLWGLNSQVGKPLFVKTSNDNWYSFSMNQNIEGLYFDKLIIDDNNQKWGIIYNKGLFVYNDNNTISNQNDDEYKILNTSLGNGNLPSINIKSIAKDLDGEIWVGTDAGITVFYYPNLVFSGYNFDAQQILIQEGEYGQYLLSSETINSIVVDGANRKWVGTKNSGLYLLSEDGLNEVQHFTKDNSPLFSDNILSLTINHENGEVFIGTEKGLLSYRSDATQGELIQKNTLVFPNPVKQGYNGNIAISNLYQNAYVKITDINGNLVFETTALGGQANWDGTNTKNKKVNTGVYLVFSANSLGQEKMVSKILFIK